MGEKAEHESKCIYFQLNGFFELYTRQMNELKAENSRLILENQQVRARLSLDVPPLIDQLVMDVQILSNELDNTSANLAALGIRQDMALMTETARIREEMQGIRNTCSTIQMQLLNLALDKRRPSSSTSSQDKRRPDTVTKL